MSFEIHWQVLIYPFSHITSLLLGTVHSAYVYSVVLFPKNVCGVGGASHEFSEKLNLDAIRGETGAFLVFDIKSVYVVI